MADTLANRLSYTIENIDDLLLNHKDDLDGFLLARLHDLKERLDKAYWEETKNGG